MRNGRACRASAAASASLAADRGAFFAAVLRPGADKASSKAASGSAPRRSIVTEPAAILPSARPLSSASRASFAAPSATKSRFFPKRSRAAGMISIGSPSAVKIAAGRSKSASKRRARSGNASSSPARSIETTRMAKSSSNVMREQRQVSVPSASAPKPRSRSRRAAPPCGSVPASWPICAAAGCSRSKRCAPRAPGDAAPKIAAAAALAQRMRVASALQSHTGDGFSACAASRWSLRQVNSMPVPLIALVARFTANESLIRRHFRGVHAAAGLALRQPAISLMGRAARLA